MALRLAETGWQVTLIEQHKPGHVRQASAGETRLLRCAHGSDDWYAKLAWKAREGWQRLGQRVGEDLYLEAGLLWFAQDPKGWEKVSAGTLDKVGIPYEILDPSEGARFFPDYRPDGLAFLLWEPGAGVIRARRATQVTARLAANAGVTLVHGKAQPYGRAVKVGEDVLTADKVVWAGGAWLGEQFDLPLTVTKQDTLHWAVPREWTTPGTPAWVDYDASAYGHGDVDGVGMKTTSDEEGAPFDPEHGRRIVDETSVKQASAYLERRFPALAGSKVLFSQVCQYALTPDAEWIIHEVEPGVWVFGGDSGHGFKHAPALAEYVASVVDGDQAPEQRFGLHQRTPSRGLRTSGRVAG